MQEDIFSIITRFRTHQFVFTADIRQIYRQIWMHESDRPFQKILWRDEPSEPLKSYQLNTVTFGMASAPYLAIRCLFELAKINHKQYPIESEIIQGDLYVDDVLSGASSIEKLKIIKHNLTSISDQAGFQLTKFRSNVTELSSRDQANSESSKVIPITDSKALGVSWNPITDNFSYTKVQQKLYPEVTKRTILSLTTQLFDPKGLLSPIIMTAKLIVQELWQLNLKWDETVPLDTHTKWQTFKDNLCHINHIRIPRYVLIPNHIYIEMHGFADASERAYGPCIYLKSIDSNNQIVIRLLAAKSRVTPTKRPSIPRLELLAAVLLSDLMTKLKNILNLKIDKTFHWSDSQIVLCWLNQHPNRWTTFVVNRVTAVQNVSSISEWHHVKSAENPADIISRGIPASQLVNHDLWWNGPAFLRETFSYPESQTTVDPQTAPKNRKITKCFATRVRETIFDTSKHSKLNRLQRIVAWTLRFITNSKLPKEQRQFNLLQPAELDTALKQLIITAQSEKFPDEIYQLKNGISISSKSHLLPLNPFLDELGLLRVGGRIRHSNFAYNKKYPIIFPKSHALTKLIFKQEHVRLLHAGPNLISNNLRENYWPISGRNQAKLTSRLCVKCFKVNPKTTNPIMGDLPEERVTPMPPFFNTGVDYAGPILIRDKTGR